MRSPEDTALSTVRRVSRYDTTVPDHFEIACARDGMAEALRGIAKHCKYLAEKTKHTSHYDGLGMGNQAVELAYKDVAVWATAKLAELEGE